MTTFSERNGYASPRDALQIESSDGELRVSILNVFYKIFFDQEFPSGIDDIWENIWANYWHQPLDAFPGLNGILFSAVKKRFQQCEWYEPYDLIELLFAGLSQLDVDTLTESGKWEYGIDFDGESYKSVLLAEYEDLIKSALVREKAGYRLVSGRIVPITNDTELGSLEQVIDAPDTFKTARDHLSKAISLFAKRPNPDYVNTVKEAMSAAEAAAHVITGDEKATLDQALKSLRKAKKLHPALANGWGNLYGFTSDAGGIRHAEHPGDIRIDEPLAKYMLVSCSAFVNYLVETSSADETAEETD